MAPVKKSRSKIKKAHKHGLRKHVHLIKEVAPKDVPMLFISESVEVPPVLIEEPYVVATVPKSLWERFKEWVESL